MSCFFKKIHWCSLVAAAIFTYLGSTASTVFAQDSFGDFEELDLTSLLDTTIQSASAKNESISVAPAVIEVITAQQLRAWGVSNLYEAMRFVPGVEVVENTVGLENIVIRGLIPQFTNNNILFLVDGIPIFEVGSMHVYLEQIPINSIEKIEVIRGPGAVLFGTNAFAGVIHVFTKSLDQPEIRGHGQFGMPLSYDLRNDGGWTWNENRSFARLSMQAHSTQRYTGRLLGDPSGIPASFNRQETTITLLLQVDHQLENWTIWARGNYFWQEDLKCCIAPIAGADNLPNNVNAGLGTIGADWRNGDWFVGLETGYMRTIQEWQFGPLSVISPSAASIPPLQQPHDALIDIDSIRVQTKAGLTRDQYSIVFGAGHSLHSVRDIRLFLRQPNGQRADSPAQNPIRKGNTVHESNIFLQGDYQPVDILKLVAGARYSLFIADQPRAGSMTPDKKNTISPRAGLIFNLPANTTLKLLYGRGFRLPSLTDLYQEAPAGGSQGNPNLDPETIDTVELGIDSRPVDTLGFRLNAFYNRTRNNIRFVRQDAFNQNISNATGTSVRGVELSLRWLPIPLIDFGLVAAFQEAFDEDPVSGNYDRYNNDIARFTSSAWLSLRPLDGLLEFTPQLNYIGERNNYQDSWLLRATAYYNVLDNLSIGLIGKNLLDVRIEDPELLNYGTLRGIEQNEPISGHLIIEAKF